MGRAGLIRRGCQQRLSVDLWAAAADAAGSVSRVVDKAGGRGGHGHREAGLRALFGPPTGRAGRRGSRTDREHTGVMRFGFHFMDFTMPGGPAALAPAVAETARAADEIGASWFTVMDHWFQMEQFRTAHDPMLEGYTTLAFAAAHTSRVQLGTIVTGRDLPASRAAGKDRDHPGRAQRRAGVPRASARRGTSASTWRSGCRSRRSRSGSNGWRRPSRSRCRCGATDDGPYDGTHYHLAETINVPSPVSRPRPRIVIGGSGERKTLRMVAQYADATNLIVSGPEQARQKLSVLRRHCDDLGRDYDTIEKTVQGPRANPVDDPDGFLRLAQDYADVGIQHIHTRPIMPDPVGSVRAFGDVLAHRLAEIG